jgi:hypothetical protein
MSKIAFTPNASGTGTFSIASPGTNTDRTLTLPDATGTVNTSGAVNEVPAGSASAPAIYPTGDTNTGIFFPAADTIAFSEGGVESMRVNSIGNLLVGTTSSQQRLTVATTTDFGGISIWNPSTAATTSKRGRILFQNTDTVGTVKETASIYAEPVDVDVVNSSIVFSTRTSDTNAERARINHVGEFLVGQVVSGVPPSPGTGVSIIPDGQVYATFNTASPRNTYHLFNQNAVNNGYRFYVADNGGIRNYSANNTNLSDERVKTDIAPLGSYWDKIKALEVVTYKYRDQSHEDDNIGVIAQQVESVAPEFVNSDGFGDTPDDGVPLKSIYEADLHYATLKALQEAMARIEALEARITALEAN